MSLGAANTDEIVSQVNRQLKEEFVREHHHRAISYITSRKRWRTRVGNPRRDVERKSREELIEYLYEYYSQQSIFSQEEARHAETSRKELSVLDMPIAPRGSLEEAFQYYIYRKKLRGRNIATIQRNQMTFRKFVSAEFSRTKIAAIGQDDILLEVNTSLKKLEKEKGRKVRIREVKDFLQVLRGVFEVAEMKQMIHFNPTLGLRKDDFQSLCDVSHKVADEKILSPRMIRKLWDYELARCDNPRSLMILFAIKTGLRAGELPCLRWTDVSDYDIHVHRQQRIVIEEGLRKGFEELCWTKDEKGESKGGRFVPMFPGLKGILDLARKWQDERGLDSEFIFCDEEGHWITKTSYEQHLRKHCQELGFQITNNHALRMSLNSNVLIPAGYDVRERSRILGHSIEVNEKFYSHAGSFLRPQIYQKASKVKDGLMVESYAKLEKSVMAV